MSKHWFHINKEKCIQRPNKYENLSLFQFVKTINVCGSKYYETRNENIVSIYPIIKLVDGIHTEEYYRQQSILHITFRQNIDKLWKSCGVGKEITWFENFENNNLTCIHSLKMPESTEHDEDKFVRKNHIHIIMRLKWLLRFYIKNRIKN